MPIVQIARSKTQRGQNVIVGEKEGFSKAYPWIMMHWAQGELETEPQYETFVSWLEKISSWDKNSLHAANVKDSANLKLRLFEKKNRKTMIMMLDANIGTHQDDNFSCYRLYVWPAHVSA